MANFAYVEDGVVERVYDTLPEVWNNVSNFFALEYEVEYLKSLGWHHIVKDSEFTYNPNTHTLLPPTFEYVDGQVFQRDTAELTPARPVEPNGPRTIHGVRMQRNAMMDAMRYRYERYQRNERLGLPQVDVLEEMDAYMQQLADITNAEDINIITWPEYPPQRTE